MTFGDFVNEVSDRCSLSRPMDFSSRHLINCDSNDADSGIDSFVIRDGLAKFKQPT